MTETPIRRLTFVKGGVKLFGVTEHAAATKPGQVLTLEVHDDGARVMRVERSGRPPVWVPWHCIGTYAVESAPPVKLAKAKGKPE